MTASSASSQTRRQGVRLPAACSLSSSYPPSPAIFQLVQRDFSRCQRIRQCQGRVYHHDAGIGSAAGDGGGRCSAPQPPKILNCRRSILQQVNNERHSSGGKCIFWNRFSAAIFEEEGGKEQEAGGEVGGYVFTWE